jgi:tyrosine decarboxylase/aspartate 1-decarboxylase
MDREELELLGEALEHLRGGFNHLPPTGATADVERLRPVLLELAERLRDNYPYHHPLYAGQMMKPPHPVARLSHALATYLNPNNHALDGGRATSAMEKEAVAEIAAMFGWREHVGHLTGGGTLANMEALWVAGQLAPGKLVVASDQAHYTHARLCGVLGLPFQAVPTDERGRMRLDALTELLAGGEVGTVVATIGTTATGAVDPLAEILPLARRHSARVHADAAYGGYFGLAEGLASETRAAYAELASVDSICVDPHKHGLQPYGCGCVLFADPSVGRFYRHDSPYTYFTSAELHLGEISLECSRAGAAAAALWATQRLMPLVPGGELAAIVSRCRSAARDLAGRLRDDERWLLPFEPQLDIVVWTPRAAEPAESSTRARRVFEAAAQRDLHLALATLPARFFAPWRDRDESVTCLRSVLMKPEHADWVEPIVRLLNESLVD